MDLDESCTEVTSLTGRSSKPSRIRVALTFGLIGVAVLAVGFAIGYTTRGGGQAPMTSQSTDRETQQINNAADIDVQHEIFSRLKASNIRENLRAWTAFPHLAGTEGEHRLANQLSDVWTDQGLDRVVKRSYDVLLSFPDVDDPNLVHLVDEEGRVQFSTQPVELPRSPADNRTDNTPPYSGFSPPGDVQADLVYVNYGRVEDFARLTQELRVNLTGKLALIRYGKIFRGDKVRLAAEHGAVGVVLYSDLEDVNLAGVSEAPYPASWWMPPSGVQRGTIRSADGDCLTPGRPATDYAYRLSESEANLPSIPTHPISYGDAQQFISRLGGAVAPDDWQGGLPLTYHVGPGFQGQHNQWQVRLHVTSYNKRGTITDVFGLIEGREEPDRYVVVGNHRDAWVVGAMDPTSGTAVVSEISRVFAEIVKETGWRPKRSILFASWGGEELGLLGSWEWVEDYLSLLGDRVVANVNLDAALSGSQRMAVKGLPLLYDLARVSAKQVATPNTPGQTLYDEWLQYLPERDSSGALTGLPEVEGAGTGSDHAAFFAVAGIPVVDVSWESDPSLSLSNSPLYHSAYETFYLVDQFVDPGFKHSLAIGKYVSELTRRLADDIILPLDVSTYAHNIDEQLKQLKADFGQLMSRHGISLDILTNAVHNFKNVAIEFKNSISDSNTHDPLTARRLNDALMSVERAFVDSEGLPGRPNIKHLVYAPSQFDAYSSATFPGLRDLMFQIEGAVDAAGRWEDVKRHLATVIHSVDTASNCLRDPSEFIQP